MKQWIDHTIGRVTMYRLVTITLAVIAVAAIVYSLLGLFDYRPLDLVASAAVALMASWLSNRAFAALLRLTPHGESSIITGLLLFFLFWPSTRPLDLLVLAGAAVLASASKYLIVVRGRHLLNPAAAGALLVTLSALGASVWWVATPLLLPFTMLGAALILYRTRRLALGASFVALAAGIVTQRLTLFGQDPLAALGTALGSYPILFVAGFMLSEPLTLAPRRWQQVAVALVAAAVFALPYQFGPVYPTPELAIVVANLVAFLFGQRQGIRLRFLGRRTLTASSWEFVFSPARPVRFQPGQFIELTIPHRAADVRGTRRVFSISSAPKAEGPISVAISAPEPVSSFKRAFLELEPGADVVATSVGGDFLLPTDPGHKLVLIAGGIGITPFVSHIAHARERGEERDLVVVYAVRSPEEIHYLDELVTAGVRVVLFAPEAPEVLPMGWCYAGPGRITEESLLGCVPDIADRRAYLSGPPGIVNGVRPLLRKLGVKRVHADAFSGY